MTFAFIITNLAGGGAEKVLLTLASALTRRGHRVELMLLENRVEHVVPADLTVTTLMEKAMHGWFGKWLLARRLARHLTGRFDLVVSALPFANEVAIRARLARHWCRIDNTLGVEIENLKVRSPRKAKRRLRRYQLLFGRRPLIAISDGMIADLRERIGVRGHIEKIVNPFDFEAIRRAANVIPANLPSVPYALHVGRFNAQKRHDVLLDAWAKFSGDHRLLLLTAPNARLQAMIDERGLRERVVIAGFQQNPYPWIARARLLVLSSDFEGLPSVIIEAIALGTPVVSTDCPSGPREILGAVCPRCLVPCADAAALAKAIEAVWWKPPDVSGVDISMYQAGAVAIEYERIAAAP